MLRLDLRKAVLWIRIRWIRNSELRIHIRVPGSLLFFKDSQFLNPYIHAYQIYNGSRLGFQLGHPHPDMMWPKLTHKNGNKRGNISRDSLCRVDNATDWKLGQLGVFKEINCIFSTCLLYFFVSSKKHGSRSGTSFCYTFMMKV
jgi:hypothetical protein